MRRVGRAVLRRQGGRRDHAVADLSRLLAHGERALLHGGGAHNVLITDPRDLPALVKLFRRTRVAYMTAVNTLFNALLNTPAFAELDFGSLRVYMGGGMAVQREVAQRWQEVTGIP